MTCIRPNSLAALLSRRLRWLRREGEGMNGLVIDGRYSQGVCEDGAAILCDGKRMTVDEIVAALNALLEALELIAGTDPVDAALDPGRAIRVARVTVARATGATP